MKKNYKPEPITKSVLFQSPDNSIELYTLTRGQVSETYLRRGNSVELVEGEVNLTWKPDEPEHVLNFRTLRYGEISQSNGLKVKTLPKLKAR